MTVRKERITVSLPASLVEQAKQAVAAGEVSDVSAYVAEALAARKAKNESRDALAVLFDDIGAPATEHDAWAQRVLRLERKAAA